MPNLPMNTLARRLGISSVVTLLTVSAHAHPGHDVLPAFNFAGGFAHPFSGWAHVLAASAAGIWSASFGGRAGVAISAAFISGMVLGTVVWRSGFVAPMLDQGIAATLLVLGLVSLRAQKTAVALGSMLIGFGLLHSTVAGVFSPGECSPLVYIGVIAATGLLHLTAVAVGQFFTSRLSAAKTRIGWGIAALGLAAFAAV